MAALNKKEDPPVNSQHTKRQINYPHSICSNFIVLLCTAEIQRVQSMMGTSARTN